MPKFLIAILVFMLSSQVYGQRILRGKVVDANENPISNAKIEELGSTNVAFSDFDGRFEMRYYSEEDILLFSHPQFDSLRVNFFANRELVVFLNLKADNNPYNLGGTVGFLDFDQKIPNKRLENMPYILGQADINRQLQNLPGIEHGNEGFSNLFIRGGDVDQNLMLYNGTPIYNFNHAFGAASVFHSKSIGNTKVYKGIAPARYGGRASSVIEVESAKDAEFSGVKGEFEINPMSGGLYIESIKKNKSYFTISARRSWIDLLFPVETRQNSFNFNFYDIQTNFGFKLENDDRLDFSIMGTRDLYFLSILIESDSNTSESAKYNILRKWSNLLSSVKYTQKIDAKMVAEHSIHYSQFKSTIGLSEEVLINDFNTPNPYGEELLNRGVRDIILRSNWNRILSNRNHLNFGLESNIRSFLVGNYVYNSRNYPGQEDNSIELGSSKYKASFENSLYIENQYQVTEKFKANYGARATFFMYDGYSATGFQPRVNAIYKLDDKSVMKFGYNAHNQFLHLLNLGESGDIWNVWAPATELVKPQVSHIAEVGYERLVGTKYALMANAYYKYMNNLTRISNRDDVTDPSKDWQSAVFQGSGSSYGLEIMFQKNEGDLTGWLSYTLAKSSRNFPDLYEDDFLFNHDRTHMLKFYMNVVTYGDWNFGVNFLVGSGQLYTLPIGRFRDLSGNIQLEYNTLNNYRSPVYHRIDFSFIRIKDLIGPEQQWKFYLYNAYGARNPSNINAQFEGGLNGLQIERNYLAYVPGVAYILKF